MSRHVIRLLRRSEDEEKWDKPWWIHNTAWRFTTTSAWDFLREKHEVCLKDKYILTVKIPFKLSFFNWRSCKQRHPISEVLFRNMMSDGVVCGCCDNGVQDTSEHLFIICSLSNSLLRYFEWLAGMEGPFLQLKDTLFKWWNEDAFAMRKPVVMVMPLFICWQV